MAMTGVKYRKTIELQKADLSPPNYHPRHQEIESQTLARYLHVAPGHGKKNAARNIHLIQLKS
jgi:hypothetical protein